MANLLIFISFLMLMITAFFGFMNMKDYKNSVGSIRNMEEQLAEKSRDLEKEKVVLDEANKELEDLERTTKEIEEQHAAKSVEFDELDRRIAELEREVEQKQRQEENYSEDVAAWGNLDDLKGKFEKLNTEIEEIEKAIVAEEQKLQIAEERNEKQKEKIALAQSEVDSGRMAHQENFQAKVVEINEKWRFIVLNKGADDGVLPQTELIVSRRADSIAKVVVTTVEPKKAIASVSELSQPIRLGDKVVLPIKNEETVIEEESN